MSVSNAKFEARTTENVSKLKQVLRPAKDLASEGLLQVKKDKIRFVAADPAMVGVVNFTIKKEYWDSYKVSEEFQAGINIENLFHFLKSANNEEEIVLEYGEGETDDIWMNTIEAEHGLTFRTGLSSLNISEDDIPTTGDLEYDNQLRVKTDVVQRILGLFEGKSDEMTFISKENSLEVKTHTDHFKNLETVIEKGEILKVDRFSEEARSKFSREYMETQMKGRTIPSLTDEVKVFMGTDFPMKISTEDEEISYEFVLAPRIEEE